MNFRCCDMSVLGGTIFGIAFRFLKVTAEFIATVFFSLFPVVISSGMKASLTEDGFWDSFLASFSYGEVFMYTSAFLVPYIVWRARYESAGKVFKEFRFYAFLYALLVGSWLFTLIRVGHDTNTLIKVTPENIKFYGVSVVVSTALIWYFSVWDNYREVKDAGKKAQKEQGAISAAVERSLGGN